MIGLSPTAYWRRRLGNALARRLLPADAQHRRSLGNIRTDLAALGFPMDDLTDEEFEAGMLRVGQAVRDCGVSIEDAARAFRAFSDAVPDEMRAAIRRIEEG